MNSHDKSMREHGTFYYNGKKVIGYGLVSGGGGATTVFSFLDEADAETFFDTYFGHMESALEKDEEDVFHAFCHNAQIVCVAFYKEAMEHVDNASIKQLTYSTGDM